MQCKGAHSTPRVEVNLESLPTRVDEQVVWLEVAVADALAVHVLERLEALVHVQAHVVDGEARSLLLVLKRERSDRLRHVVHH